MFPAYFRKFSKIAYETVWIISIHFIFCCRKSLYINTYHYKKLCYKLQLNYLFKQVLYFDCEGIGSVSEEILRGERFGGLGLYFDILKIKRTT